MALSYGRKSSYVYDTMQLRLFLARAPGLGLASGEEQVGSSGVEPPGADSIPPPTPRVCSH